jgi:serine/threonine protein kinase/WD40 repeat protein/tetratricopeptide (TPR) repeat protein
MTDPLEHRSPVEQLAEQFLERYRRGEHPPLSEYKRKYPHLADEIADLFPALVMMEEAGRRVGAPGAFHGRITANGEPLRQLGDYSILREVGRGGMGIVYEAEQETLGRHVALKILPFEAAADPVARRRFQREARSTARLHHTNIVPVYDVGAHDGVHYYAMQFIQGRALDEVMVELRRLRSAGKPVQTAESTGSYLSSQPGLSPSLAGSLFSGQFCSAEPPDERGEGTRSASALPSERPGSLLGTGENSRLRETIPLPLHAGMPASEESLSAFSTQSSQPYYRSVARVGLQVAEALAYAHSQKVLHRDIKPSNLLLDVYGRVWVTDFGLAKDEGDALTCVGDVVGTLRYMAPERFSGLSDVRGDIYSLGLTLYELVTFRPAFEDTDRAGLIRQVTQQDPPAPRKVDRRLPRDLETIILKAIAKEPHRRYATAEALAEDLRRFLGDRPILARRTSWAGHAWRWCRRNPGWAATLGTVGVLLLVILFGGVVLNLHLQNALTRTQEAERDQTEKLWHSHLERARAKRSSARMGQRFEALKAIEDASKIRITPELRDEAAAALVLPDIELAREWEGCTDDTIGVAFDGSLTRYVTLQRDGNLTVWRLGAAGREEVARLPAHGRPPFYSIAMSPDGRFVAYGHSSIRQGTARELRLWKLDDPAPSVVLDEPAGLYEHALAFDPAGRYLAVGHGDRSVSVYEPETGRHVGRIAIGTPPQNLAFHPRDGRLAVACGNAVRIFDLPAGKESRVLRHVDKVKWISGLAWHPDGRRLATACDDHQMHIWDADTGVEVMTPWTGQRSGTIMAFNHAGDRLVTSDWVAQTRLWDVATGQLLLTMPAFFGLQFSPDDRLLGAGQDGRKLQLWRLASGCELCTLRRPRADGAEEILAPALCESYGLLATTCRKTDGSGRCWLSFFDLRGGEELGSVRLPTGLEAEVRNFDGKDGWLTAGSAGVLAWPVRTEEVNMQGRKDLLQIGPPWHLGPSASLPGVGASRDGRVIAVPQRAGAVVLNRNRPGWRVFLGPQYDVRYCAVSTDARWVVTCSHWTDSRSPSARIWDAETGRHACDLPLGGGCVASFSPDGRWLATADGGGGRWRLWEVGTWQEKLCFAGGSFAFSPDSRLVALSQALGMIHLLETETGREVARLMGPEPTRYEPACFSADGTRLVATDPDHKALHIWDLRALRGQLKALDLDWDWPDFSPPNPPPSSRPALAMQIDQGFLRAPIFDDDPQAIAIFSLCLALRPLNPEAYLQRGLAHGRLGNWQRAIDDYNCFLDFAPRNDPRRVEILVRRANNYYVHKDYTRAAQALDELLSVRPDLIPWSDDFALMCNNVAWHYVKAVQHHALPANLLAMAQKAVETAPYGSHFRNTLGIVYYRLGRYPDAVTCLHMALEEVQEPAAFDLYVLCMTYQKMGQSANAKECFDRANAWRQAHADQPAEVRADLAAFHLEAAELISNHPSVRAR